MKYPATQPALPSDLKGAHFCAVFGTQARAASDAKHAGHRYNCL